jgi:integrase
MQVTCSLPHHLSVQQILTATAQAQKAPAQPQLDQDADRTWLKSSRAFQIELSETLTPLPDVPDPGTLLAAVSVQRDRRSMSRRPGQNGRIEKRGGSFSLLFHQDVPGTRKRQRVRRSLKATTMVAAKQEAQRIIDAEGVNTAAHLEASRGAVVTFGFAAELWKSQQLEANGKHSSKRTMDCELNKHVFSHLKHTPIQDITYPVIRGLVCAWKKEGLGNKSMRNLFGIVRAVYNFFLDETLQHGKTTMLPWLIKWSKVEPAADVEADAPCFTPEQMAAIVEMGRGQYRSLFAVAAGGGLRAGELFALRVEDVNLKDGVITVRRSIVEGMEGTPKNGKIRHVPIDSSVVAEVKKHLNGSKSELVWHSNRCTPLRLNSVLKWQLKPILKKLKIKFPGRNGMPAFRHGRISYLAYSGVTFAVIREWVGHGSDAMIKHYMAKWQSNNAGEMAKLQPVVRTENRQNGGCNGNEVALLEPVGTKLTGKEAGGKAA